MQQLGLTPHRKTAHERVRPHCPRAGKRILLGVSLAQPGKSSFFEAVSGRSHSET
jgi:hypothetical protein